MILGKGKTVQKSFSRGSYRWKNLHTTLFFRFFQLWRLIVNIKHNLVRKKRLHNENNWIKRRKRTIEENLLCTCRARYHGLCCRCATSARSHRLSSSTPPASELFIWSSLSPSSSSSSSSWSPTTSFSNLVRASGNDECWVTVINFSFCSYSPHHSFLWPAFPSFDETVWMVLEIWVLSALYNRGVKPAERTP